MGGGLWQLLAVFFMIAGIVYFYLQIQTELGLQLSSHYLPTITDASPLYFYFSLHYSYYLIIASCTLDIIAVPISLYFAFLPQYQAELKRKESLAASPARGTPTGNVPDTPTLLAQIERRGSSTPKHHNIKVVRINNINASLQNSPMSGRQLTPSDNQQFRSRQSSAIPKSRQSSIQVRNRQDSVAPDGVQSSFERDIEKEAAYVEPERATAAGFLGKLMVSGKNDQKSESSQKLLEND
ncbi:hypothetical protein HK096_011123 [Nowakowskiella sp. JEL0078]|nr:hypothetical protein HK096_011123 [Nowakowskiella sp. JEL0078]